MNDQPLSPGPAGRPEQAGPLARAAEVVGAILRPGRVQEEAIAEALRAQVTGVAKNPQGSGADSGLPNSWVVTLSPRDARGLGDRDALAERLIRVLRSTASDAGLSFGGMTTVRVVDEPDHDEGTFDLTARHEVPSNPDIADPGSAPRIHTEGDHDGQVPGRPRLVLGTGGHTTGGSPESVGAMREVEIGWDGLVVGRSNKADLTLHDPLLEPEHARITIKPEPERDRPAVIVTDLGGASGIVVAGRRVVQTELYDGDRVQLGGQTLIYQREEQKPS